jgi:hypothetical protein
MVNQTRFGSAAELESTLRNYVKIYNHNIPQRALKHQTPIQALKNGMQSALNCSLSVYIARRVMITSKVLFQPIFLLLSVKPPNVDGGLRNPLQDRKRCRTSA